MTAAREGADLHVYVDADACPVKPEVYRVAERYGLPVILVAAIRSRFLQALDGAIQAIRRARL